MLGVADAFRIALRDFAILGRLHAAAYVNIDVHSLLDGLELKLRLVVTGKAGGAVTIRLFIVIPVDGSVIESVLFVPGGNGVVGTRSEVAFMAELQEVLVLSEACSVAHQALFVPEIIGFIGIVEVIIAVPELIMVAEQRHRFSHIFNFVSRQFICGVLRHFGFICGVHRHFGILTEAQKIHQSVVVVHLFAHIIYQFLVIGKVSRGFTPF